MSKAADLATPAPYTPPMLIFEGVYYVPATAAAKYLGCSYSTVGNLINSRNKYLVAKRIEGTLYVTADSLETEKKRRNAKALKKVAA